MIKTKRQNKTRQREGSREGREEDGDSPPRTQKVGNDGCRKQMQMGGKKNPPLCQWELSGAGERHFRQYPYASDRPQPIPCAGRVPHGDSSESCHRVPAKPPLTWFRGQSVCPCSLLLLYPAALPSPKFGVLPEGPSLPPLSPASSSSLDPLALEVTGGQQGLQICP